MRFLQSLQPDSDPVLLITFLVFMTFLSVVISVVIGKTIRTENKGKVFREKIKPGDEVYVGGHPGFIVEEVNEEEVKVSCIVSRRRIYPPERKIIKK